MKTQFLPGLERRDQDGPLSSLDLGSRGILKLDAIRPTVLRAGRLAETMFGALEADVFALQGGRLWRGKTSRTFADDVLAREIASGAGGSVWIADTHADPLWRDRPGVRGPPSIRFCAIAPISMRGGAHLAALRVVDIHPRAYDPVLASALEDLASFVADECNWLLEGEVRRMRELFDQAPGFMAIVAGPDHVFELVNDAYLAVVGHRDLIGRPLNEALPEVGPQGFTALLDDVFHYGRPYVAQAAEVLLHRRPGRPLETVFIDFVYQPIRDGDGIVTGVFIQGNDVTREKLAADELKESARELATALSVTQTILDQSLDVILTCDADGVFTKVSQQAEEVWGYRPDELVGRPYLDFVHPEDHAMTIAVAEDIMSGAATKAFSNRFIHKDGAVVPIMWSSVWSLEHGKMFAIARDMREHQAAEEMLRQSQKMEAVGQLTGGVAHDFNNLLTVVIGSAEALAERLHDQPDLELMAQGVLEAAEKGAELVSRLLAFSRKQPLAARSLDCKTVLDGLLPMLARTLGEDVAVEIHSESGLYCLADPTQLTSALLNLAINARDAMPAGGRLSIRAGRPRRSGEDDTRSTDGMVVFSVQDTGHGMSSETMERVLEPFFTTKPAGLGSGLGLSMVYGFAKQSGGDLSIRSRPARGTRVSILIPEGVTTHTASPAVTKRHPAPGFSPGGQHILLVEDDDLVRRQAESHLAILGYRVTAFGNGRDALARMTQTRDVDLLLTDIVMPGGMDGRELAARARELVPDLHVVLTSGYSSDMVRKAALPDIKAQFLGKPYRRAELARVLQKAFDDDAPSADAGDVP